MFKLTIKLSETKSIVSHCFTWEQVLKEIDLFFEKEKVFHSLVVELVER